MVLTAFDSVLGSLCRLQPPTSPHQPHTSNYLVSCYSKAPICSTPLKSEHIPERPPQHLWEGYSRFQYVVSWQKSDLPLT